jgi:hypothetical protein
VEEEHRRPVAELPVGEPQYAGMAVLPGVAGWLEDTAGRAAAIEFAAAAIVVALVAYLAFRRLIAADAGLARAA